MRDYWKLIWSVLGAIAVFIQTAVSDGVMTGPEVVASIAIGLQAIGVWVIPDTVVMRFAKNVVTVLLAGTAVLELAIIDGVDGAEWLTIMIALVQAGAAIADPRRPVHATDANRQVAA
jgi:hypothetical protein